MEIIFGSKLIDGREMEPWVCSLKNYYMQLQKMEIIYRSKLIEAREMEPWVCFRKNKNVYHNKKREFNCIEHNGDIFVLTY